MKNIEENNKLIAEFMDAMIEIGKQSNKEMFKFLPNNEKFCSDIHIQTHDGEYIFFEKELLFDKSWDWLKPVVNKIFTLGNNQVLTNEINDCIKITFYKVEIYSSIKKVYLSTIKFIKWYNKQEND